MKLNSRDTSDDHFVHFDSVIRELEEMGTKIDEADKVCYLMLTLPKDYDTVITALEKVPDVRMDYVKSRLLDMEMKLKNPSSRRKKVDQWRPKKKQGCPHSDCQPSVGEIHTLTA